MTQQPSPIIGLITYPGFLATGRFRLWREKIWQNAVNAGITASKDTFQY